MAVIELDSAWNLQVLLAWVQMSMLLNGTWPVVNLESPMEVVYSWCLSLIKGLQSMQPTSAGTISKFFWLLLSNSPLISVLNYCKEFPLHLMLRQGFELKHLFII